MSDQRAHVRFVMHFSQQEIMEPFHYDGQIDLVSLQPLRTNRERGAIEKIESKKYSRRLERGSMTKGN